MTFQDIFKSSFLGNMRSISLVDMVLALALSFVVGLFIYFIYKKSYSGVMYSSSFGLTLIALNMITTLVILAITSNIILSLGMVGALSIVRFRTAIKDPMDIAFLFWSIASGIVMAAGLIPLAVLGSVMIGLVLYFFSTRQPTDQPYILVIHAPVEVESDLMELISEATQRSVIKSKIIENDNLELNIELRLKNQNTDFINQLEGLGATRAVLVSYNGDYLG